MIFCTACGHPRNGPVRFCTACGAPFPDGLSGEPAAAEQATRARHRAAADDPPNTVTVYRPPGALAVPAHGAAPAPAAAPAHSCVPAPATPHDLAASWQLAAGGARQDPFGYPQEPRGEGRAGLSELFGGMAQDDRAGSSEPRYLPAGLSPDPCLAPSGRRRMAVAVLAAAVILVAVAGGADLWLMHRPRGAPRAGAPRAGPALAPSSAPAHPAAPAVSESVVTVAPGVRKNPDAARVENFIVGYFAAINGHSYRKFSRLLGHQMRQQEPATKFYPGYESTTDSAAVLTAISDSREGLVGAVISFTSHQLPADTPSHSACTNWSITLYLSRHHGRYLLRPPPPGYHAVYQPC